MNLKDLIIKKLEEMGADGLVCIENDCGCGTIDDNLMCCDCPSLTDCEPAKRRADGRYYILEEA